MGFVRFLSGSQFMTQIIFAFLLGYFWGHYFYVYLRKPISWYVADILVHKGSRQRATKYYMVIIYGIVFFAIFMCIIRRYFRNEEENLKLLEAIKQKCNHFYVPEDQSMKDCLIMIFPLVLLLMYSFVNVGESLRLESDSQKVQRGDKEVDIRY